MLSCHLPFSIVIACTRIAQFSHEHANNTDINICFSDSFVGNYLQISKNTGKWMIHGFMRKSVIYLLIGRIEKIIDLDIQIY